MSQEFTVNVIQQGSFQFWGQGPFWEFRANGWLLETVPPQERSERVERACLAAMLISAARTMGIGLEMSTTDQKDETPAPDLNAERAAAELINKLKGS